MRKAVILTLVVVLVVTGLPLLMGGMTCPSCPPAAAAGSLAGCVAVLAALMILFALGMSSRRVVKVSQRHRLYALRFERPPRLLAG